MYLFKHPAADCRGKLCIQPPAHGRWLSEHQACTDPIGGRKGFVQLCRRLIKISRISPQRIGRLGGAGQNCGIEGGQRRHDLGADSIADIYASFEEDADGQYKDRQTVTVAGMITSQWS